MAELTKVGKAAKDAQLALNQTMTRDEVIAQYAIDKEQLELLEGATAAHKETLLLSLLENGEEKYELEGVGSASIQPGRKTEYVDPRKLLENGVSPEVIAESTVSREGDPFVVIRTVRKKQEEGG